MSFTQDTSHLTLTLVTPHALHKCCAIHENTLSLDRAHPPYTRQNTVRINSSAQSVMGSITLHPIPDQSPGQKKADPISMQCGEADTIPVIDVAF